MSEKWEDTRREFCRIAAKRGVGNIADEIPANRATAYRLIRGETNTPSRAIRAGIERIVERERTKEQPE